MARPVSVCPDHRVMVAMRDPRRRGKNQPCVLWGEFCEGACSASAIAASPRSREPRVEVRNLGPHLGEISPELVGGDVVALLKAVVDRLRDDLGLVAVDAAGGELLGDGERVEHCPAACHAAGTGETPLTLGA